MQDGAWIFAHALKSGQKAAKAMWSRTRERGVSGQNEKLTKIDHARLHGWRQWLKQALHHPAIAMATSPVCGVWQLQFTVHNFAPAVQNIVIERQELDGTWRELASRYTIEFRARSAQPHSKIKREFTVPVDSPRTPLRIAVRGVGQAAISHMTLTSGADILRDARFRLKKNLGCPAPHHGLPDLNTVPAAMPVRCK